MPARIPDSIREGVIQSWLEGLSFRTISARHALSEGSVCNIVTEEKNRYGSAQLDFYRDLGIAMHKSGLTVQQCADGHRTAQMMKRLGVDETFFDGFIERLWKHYLSVGLGPENLAKQIEELHYFLQRNQGLSGATSISQICDEISAKQAEERRLRSQITDLGLEKRNLEIKLFEIRSQILAAESEIGLSQELKEKLKANRLRRDDLPYSIDLAGIVMRSGYSMQEMAERFSTMAELENLLLNLGSKKTQEGIMHDQLVRENTELKEINFKYSQKLRELVILDEIGFGLSEFKQLHGLLNEIAETYELPTEVNAAVRLFFENLHSHYYDYLDLEKSIQKLKAEIETLKRQRDNQLLALNLTPDVKNVIDSLTRTGIKRDDFDEILKFVKLYSLSQIDESALKSRTNEVTRENKNQKLAGESDSQKSGSKKTGVEGDQYA
jgi:hypothetical protein